MQQRLFLQSYQMPWICAATCQAGSKKLPLISEVRYKYLIHVQWQDWLIHVTLIA